MSGSIDHRASTADYIDLTVGSEREANRSTADVVAAFIDFLDWVAVERADEALGDVMADLLATGNGPPMWKSLLGSVPSQLEGARAAAPAERPAILTEIDRLVHELGFVALAEHVERAVLGDAGGTGAGGNDLTIDRIVMPSGPYELVDGWLIHRDFDPSDTEDLVQALLDSGPFTTDEASLLLASAGIRPASVGPVLAAHPDVVSLGLDRWGRA